MWHAMRDVGWMTQRGLLCCVLGIVGAVQMRNCWTGRQAGRQTCNRSASEGLGLGPAVQPAYAIPGNSLQLMFCCLPGKIETNITLLSGPHRSGRAGDTMRKWLEVSQAARAAELANAAQ